MIPDVAKSSPFCTNHADIRRHQFSGLAVCLSLDRRANTTPQGRPSASAESMAPQ